jgi:hypothetical protein
MSDWYIGVPKILTFTINAIDAGDVVFLDYWRTIDSVVIPLPATILSYSTGDCTAQLTPTMTGNYHFWPRVVSSDGKIVNIGTPKIVWVYPPGIIPTGTIS